MRHGNKSNSLLICPTVKMADYNQSVPPPPYPGTSGTDPSAPPAYKDVPKTYAGVPQHYSYQNGPQIAPGYPTQPGYPAQPYPTTTVIMTQPQLTMVQTFRQTPVRCICPNCRADVMTATSHETGALTWVLCAVIFFLGFFCGCCFLPFCIDEAKDVIHTCPNCKQVIARYNRL